MNADTIKNQSLVVTRTIRLDLRLTLALVIVNVISCGTRHAGGTLGEVDEPIPMAQPCGDGCPDGTTCVPVIDDDGTPAFACVDVHLRFCAPCSEDADCYDAFMPDAGSVCRQWNDGSGSFCATDCSQHADCPSGSYCATSETDRAICLPESGTCICSQWAIENANPTQCSQSNVHGSCIGLRECTASGLSDCDAPIAASETCNGIDDDCDQSIDETFPEAGEPCDGESDTDACLDGTIVCQDGTIVCHDESDHRIEVCNGSDDDCDDSIDNHLIPPSALLQPGVCANSLQICGGISGWLEPDYETLDKYEHVEITCDGLDNDCDGEIDDPFIASGTNVYIDPVSQDPLTKGESCGTGRCQGGTVICNDRGDGLACSTATDATTEVCDGLDNNCNGLTDEGVSPPLALLQAGVCRGMVQLCDGDRGWQEPNYATIPHFEQTEQLCDGLDNDCDGALDEGLRPVLAENQLGVCGGSVQVCSGSNGWTSPTLTAIDHYEIIETSCDGRDNDCDGLADNNLESPLASNHSGVCAGALKQCFGHRGWLDPNYRIIERYEATEVSCDGVDNDCDGSIDDSLAPPPATLNQGVCAELTKSCSGQAGWLDPDFTSITSYEVTETLCDDQDNDCDGDIDEAHDLTSDVGNCGVCNLQCEFPHALPQCTAGTCGIALCHEGYDNCDTNELNGCEVNTHTDLDHCGACNDPCDPPQATGACLAGTCTIATCLEYHQDCNNQIADGCEVNTQTDLNNCGTCGSLCNAPQATTTCQEGQCSITTCLSTYSNCDGSLLNGCEVDLATDPDNCGSCALSCSNDHGTTTCSSGTCAPNCDALWGNCDGSLPNGCETPLTTLAACGACGIMCDLPNASESCNQGSCQLRGCNAGFANCDSIQGNGCEIELASDPLNCGTCGNSCMNTHGTSSCIAGACVPVCDDNWADCDGNSANGCETSLTTASNCGACGQVCNLTHGTETCAMGTCELTSCDVGYGDCDENIINGCEIDLLTDRSNCGMCETLCDNVHGATTCASGLCRPLCEMGFGDCDANALNGCEQPLNTLLHCGGCGAQCDLANAIETCPSSVCEVVECENKWCNANGSQADGCEFNLDTNPSCDTDAIILGSVAGDEGNQSISRTDYGEQWFRVYVLESSFLETPLSVRISLESPFPTNYDLLAHKDNCDTNTTTSILGVDQIDSVNYRWDEDWESCIGCDESAWVWIHVTPHTASTCSPYTLVIEGNR